MIVVELLEEPVTTPIRVLPTASVDYEAAAETLAALGFDRHDYLAEQAPNEAIWLTSDANTVIRWVEDDLIDVTYIAVLGADAEAVAERIRTAMPTDDVAQLRARAIADRDPGLLIDVLYRTAVVAWSGYDREAFALLRWGLHDPDPLLRRAALVAVSITRWHAFAEVLQDIRTHDPDDEVRDQAARVHELVRSGN
ncbi:HEAT repeat domain-containing protein [Yinghuangia seranimata]|uniref:HEAT repeat domain-containing protein n=1 Tax=Yinghuangia seranimata TaxID=408067 RepID=UPI00248C74A4|nr:HEAT repeat domain-containing protein [Yinghuangia seranimata]MDI2128144.1 HEAT repeat domain-containing protein [Yinghuangia seranimata]